MSRAQAIRAELEIEERKLGDLYRHMAAGCDDLTQYFTVREAQVNHGMRRKYFLKQLLKVQIKEFDYD